MTPYWILFLFPVLATLLPFRADLQLRVLGFILFAVSATLIIGLRFKVGGDWGAYLVVLDEVSGLSLLESAISNNPGYAVINWLSIQMGLGIVGVNLMGGGLLVYGLLRFCRQQPMPWLGLVVATPFLLIVLGMGYSRQAIALGFVLWALSIWHQKSFIKYSVIVLMAVFFHKSAVVMFFFGLFINDRYLLAKWLLIIPLLALIYWYFLIGFFESTAFKAYFVLHAYESSGGVVRVLMNVVPSIVLFLFSKQFMQFGDYKLWQMIGVFSLISLITVSSFSTVTDRFAIYLTPIQVAIYSRLPLVIEDRFWRKLTVLLIVLFYSLVLFVWMNYANHAYAWLPYRTVFEQ